MKAIGNYIIVKDAPRVVNKTAGGLELTDKHEDIRYIEATVVSCGENVNIIRPGNTILYDRVGGHNIVLKGEVLKIIRDRDVVIVYE